MTLPRKPARYWGDGDFNALADAIEGVSDSMPITYNQDDAPVPPIPPNSVWIDTNDGGRAYVWSGTDWVSLEGPQGQQGPPGLDGAEGDQGLPGPPGTPSYTHVAYANQDVSPWTGFSTSDGANKLYIGMFVNSTEADSQNPADYRWTLIKGADGTQGTPGAPGADGQTPYLHVAYATNSTGTTGFHLTDTTGKTYIGTYTDFTSADSTNPAMYRWVLIQGPPGQDGLDGIDGDDGLPGVSSYTHIAWSNQDVSPWAGFHVSDSTNKLYVGMYVDSNAPDSSNPADYNWTLIKGADGSQGIPGPAGSNGQTPYLHIAYANSVDGTVDFSTTVPDGRAYIGTMTNFIAADPEFPNFYTWMKVEGAPGADGSDGTNGTNGARGAGFFHLANGGASAPATAQAFADLADDVVPQPNVFQDRVTIFNNGASPPWSVTKFWDGDSWEALAQYIDGNLLVNGTVAASKLVAGSVVVTGGAAGDINSGSTTISGGKITTGTLSADKIDANGINASIITAGTLNVDRINAGSLNGTKLADNAVNGLKLKCAMGTLLINNVGRSVLGVGWASPTSAARVDLGGGVFGVRCYPSVTMSGIDYVIFIQPNGYNNWIPRVVAKASTYFDVIFGDGVNWAVDPNTWPSQIAYFYVLALDT
jgi:hypothetical protein